MAEMNPTELRNAQALANNLAELRVRFETRLQILENDVATIRSLIDRQTQVLGNVMQRMMGSGSTEQE